MYKETNTMNLQTSATPVEVTAPVVETVTVPTEEKEPVAEVVSEAVTIPTEEKVPTQNVSAVAQVPVKKTGKGLGITSMILGILALICTLLSCTCAGLGLILAAILGLLSIIFGIIAVAKKRGKGMGIAGIICSVVGLLIAIAILVITVLIAMGVIDASAYMIEYMDENGYFEQYEYEYDDWNLEDGYDNEYDIYDEDGEVDWNEVEDALNEVDWEAIEDMLNEEY